MSSYMWELKDKNKDYFKWGYLAKLKSNNIKTCNSCS